LLDSSLVQAEITQIFYPQITQINADFFGIFGEDREVAEWDGIVCSNGSLIFNKHNPSVEIPVICG
jgi:hypothetical protein